jgi:hypothetical protein
VSEDAEEEEDDAGAEEEEPSMRRLYTSKMPCLPAVLLGHRALAVVRSEPGCARLAGHHVLRRRRAARARRRRRGGGR